MTVFEAEEHNLDEWTGNWAPIRTVLIFLKNYNLIVFIFSYDNQYIFCYYLFNRAQSTNL